MCLAPVTSVILCHRGRPHRAFDTGAHAVYFLGFNSNLERFYPSLKHFPWIKTASHCFNALNSCVSYAGQESGPQAGCALHPVGPCLWPAAHEGPSPPDGHPHPPPPAAAHGALAAPAPQARAHATGKKGLDFSSFKLTSSCVLTERQTARGGWY